jgi:cellulose synthase/poly-beta-1,6-N-acetylglucosamine synthase-like glycosyltransferase
MTRATLLVPAHDEVAVIGRTLLHLSRGLPRDDVRVVVIANACSDATAAKARAVLPQATVIETERAGKCHALNLGYAAADPDAPVICLDADLDVTAECLAALLRPLRAGEARAACGHMDVATSGASALVRLFYRGWSRNPYFRRGKFGGLFALSPEAARRVFPLPEVIADDEYIRRSFGAGEIAYVPDCRFFARAPATLASLVRVRRRSLRGARQIAAMGLASPERGSLGAMARRALAHPSDALPIAVFVAVMAWVRLCLALEPAATAGRWERDLTSRAVG